MDSQFEAIKQPFSNVRLELLKVFSHHLSDSDLLGLRRLLVRFLRSGLLRRRMLLGIKWLDR